MDEAELTDETRAVAPRWRIAVGAGVVLVVLAAVIAVLVSLLAPRGTSETVQRDATVHEVLPTASASHSVLVHVVGAVKSPGLYSVAGGGRVIDAIAAAGGFSKKADQAQVNLARVVADGEQLVVPVKGARPAIGAPASSGAVGGAGTVGAMVSLNSATVTELDTLDGIGPALAQRIVDYREAHGAFSAVTDLRKVAGIGDKKFAAIKDHVTL